MSERKPNPTIAPKITRPGESIAKTGSRNVTELLPSILQTTVNKQFFDSTLEQLMSSGSLEAVKHYVGDTIGDKNGTLNSIPVTDNYLLDNRSNDAYQFKSGMVNKNDNGNIEQVLAYDDLINCLKYSEVNTNNHNKILNEIGYTLDLPINYDMFINHHRYYWALDVLPVNELKYTSTFNIETLIGETTYTTPTMKNGRTLTFENGMRIMFAPHTVDRFTQTVPGTTVFTATAQNGSDVKVYLNNSYQVESTDYTVDFATGVVTFNTAPALNQEIEIHTHYSGGTSLYDNGAIYIVDGVGEPTGIQLTKQFKSGQYEGQQGKRTWLNVTVYSSQEPAGFDADTTTFDFRPFDIREHRMTTRDYTCEQRHGPDKSAWGRSNLWIHEQTIANSMIYQGLTDDIYTLDKYKAVRPIIEYKRNIQKYKFGINHIENIDHALEDEINPATEIIGQTSYSVTVKGINEEWSAIKGYDIGQRVKVTSGALPNQVITFWECVEAHADPFRPTHGENKQYWEQIVPVELENDDLILFWGTSNATYNDKIWRVAGVGSGITLTETYNADGSNGATQINSLDKFVILNGFNIYDRNLSTAKQYTDRQEPISGCELYWNATTGKFADYGQQKMHRSQGMKVELYDTDLVSISDTTKYPNSNFEGATIFDFAHSETSNFDDALGFKPEFVDYGNNPGLNFCINLHNLRFQYVTSSADFSKSNQRDINGYYLYKDFSTSRYHNGWSILRHGQTIEKKLRKVITDSTVPLKVDVGHASFVGDRTYTFFKEGGILGAYSQPTTNVDIGRTKRLHGKLPTLFLHNSNTYTINTMFTQAEIEFVNMDGTAIGAGITRTAGSGNTFTLQIGTPTVNSIKYRLVADPTNFGVIFFSANDSETNVKVLRNGQAFTNYSHTGNIISITSGLTVDDVYEFFYATDEEYSATGEGNFGIASTQSDNPQNEATGKVSFGDLINHMKSQMLANPLLTGDWYGTNNYRNIIQVHDIGGTIRQQPYSTELLNQLLVDNNTNPFSALQFTSSSYKQFMEKFKRKMVQLHNSMDINQPVYKLVDKALEEINLGKNKDSEFANSQMAMYRDYKSVTTGWVQNQTPAFDLPEEVNNYDDTFNHIQCWIQIPDSNGYHTWIALKEGEFAIDNYTVTILKTGITFPSSGKNNIHIRWYKRDSVSFMPPSAVKLGLIKPFRPQTSNSYSKDSTGTATDSVIIGHDGSVHIRNGTELFQRQTVGFDPIDAGIWDLELRIFNNLGFELDGTLNQSKYAPNAHRPAVYTWTEVNNTIRSEFNKYKASNNISVLNSTTYYDGSDKFTWNYSSVGPGIGGWRGLYHYYFNTDRPHSHPWEMLGFNKEPAWWDANYSWTDAPKRAALLLALKYGQISDPGLGANNQVYDIDYSLKNYDWDTNTLVTLLGTLNDPVTAGVVATPSVNDRSKDFVFGDWGPVEAEWRRTSEGKLAMIIAFLKTRPLVALNNYFRTQRRQVKNLPEYNTPLEIDVDTQRLISWKDTSISGSSILGKVIESVNIVSEGTGYTSTPTVTVNDTFGINGAVEVRVLNGAIVGARVTNQGSQYYNRPSLAVSTGTATLDAILVENAKHYYSGLSNSIIEFGKLFGTSADTVRNRLENISFQPIIKAGGFINRNNEFILESSQDKGRVFVPEENFNTLLYTGKPDTEYFFGGIKIDKVANGYKIDGYDNSLAYFNYYLPNKNTPPITVSVDTVTVLRYQEYQTVISTLDYNSELSSVQAVYDFILGYGHYLESLGFTQSWRGVASDFVTWANGSSTTTLNLIPDNSKVTVNDNKNGYFDNLNKKYDGVYNIVNSTGKQIQSNNLIIDRKSMDPDAETVFQAKDTTTQIYGIRLYKVQLEHIIVFDNITNFDDTLYDPSIGQAHKRIIWRGSRTKDWNGKLYSPGYIVTDNNLIPNYDTVAREVDQYYGRTNTLANSQLSDIARFNAGYNKPDWAANLDIDDDSLYEFTKGSYKYRGTNHALKAFMRNQGLFDGEATAELLENWAIRIADYGDILKRDTLEFQVTPDLLVTNPQPVRFTEGFKHDTLSDVVIDIGSTSPLLVNGGEDGYGLTTRSVDTYKVTSDSLFSNDLIKSGLPLLTETDYRVINKEDFVQFPTEVKSAYDHSGDWQNIERWDSKRSYKFNDKVLHTGKTWAMLDPDGSSGLTTANNPIEIHGTISLPTIPSSGQTLIIDGNTITLTKTATSTTRSVITVTGTQDIGSSNVVTHGSSLVLGESASLNSTVTFSNSVTSVTFQDIIKDGTTINPTIQGSATATLIIDGNTINFNDTISSSTNISAQVAYENTFNASWTQNTGNIASYTTTRISRIEALKSAYITANSSIAWGNWISTYYTNNAGLNINHLKTLIGLGGTTETPATDLLDSDITAINNIRGTSYITANVINGSEVVTASDITNSQAEMNLGQFTDDIATYLKSATGISSTFTTSTVVATTSSSTFKLYSLADIVQEINDASISNVTASSNPSSQLRITKTTNDNTQPFSITISVGTQNSAVGLSTATETIQSTSISTITTPNLTIQQVIDQINGAGISGVTAQKNATNNNLLQINGSLDTLFIGSGTANSAIGLPTGIVPATSTTSTTSVGLNITDIVELINAASISGVTATNNANKVYLTSTNSTLVIGAGTANTNVGFTAQTYSATASEVSNVFNAIVGSDGQQVFREVTNDPNIFNIWVADDSEFGNSNLGYQVYQTMDFGSFTNNICAGPEDASEAQIDMVRQNGTTQAHNLVVNDYVLIRGSDSVPSIDGIHRVTKVDANNTARFYIDEYIETNGQTGNIYPLRKVRFGSYTALEADRQTKINGVYKYNFADVRQDNTSNPIYAFVDDDGTGASAVYSWNGTWDEINGHVGSWNKVRTGTAQARNDLINNVKLYDALNQTTIKQLEIFDPAKGIIFGFVDREIDYKITNDIANYNYNTLDGEVVNNETWGREYLGKRWWDVSTSVYLDYEQGSIDYQQNNWGRLFDGSSVDIYEWTASPVLPEQWADAVIQKLVIDGKQASGEVYSTIVNGQTVYNWSEESYFNERTAQTETVFYFWVKNKTTSYSNRNYNVFQLSQIIQNPSSYNLGWAAQAGGDSLFLANISTSVNKNTIVQLNKDTVENTEALQDWTMLAEGDANCTIPEYLHIKIRDSLAGFVKHTIDKNFTTWSSATVYAENDVVKEGTDYYLSLISNNTNHQPSTDTDMSHWSKLYDYTFIESDEADNIKIRQDEQIPDLKLHKFNRYGHLVRPRQSLYRDVKEARQNFVYSVNSLLSEVNVIDEINNWEDAFTSSFTEGTITYNIKDYTNLVDWYLIEKDSDGNVTYQFNPSTVADLVYETKADYTAAGEPSEDGTYVLIKSTSPNADIDRAEMYYYSDGTDKLVYKEKATVQLSEEMWNQGKFGHGYDAIGFDVTPFDQCSDNVISQLFDLLRTKIFIGTHHVKYNKLWFKLLFSAILQNTADDFAFKTTYTHLGVKRPLLTNKAKYQEYNIEVVEDFVNSIKPFHTKLLSSMESNTYGESTNIEIEDISRDNVITFNYADHSTRTWAGDTELLGGTFIDTPINVDLSKFYTLQADLEYDYNGQVFIQPVQEGWGKELVPTDFTENINMLVQTNPQGIVTAGATYSVNAQENQPRGITFNTDGTKMFIVGTSGDDVNEYTLSVGFDLTSTVTFVDSFSVNAQETGPTAVKFNTDGTKMFITGVSSSNVHEYALSTGFDVSTASFTQTLVTTVDNDNFGLDFKDDGTKMYITGNQTDKIHEFDLSSAYDISTATFNQDLSTQPHDYEPFGIEWSPDGTRLFIVGTIHNGVDLWYVSTPWDISTATHQEFYFVGGNPSGIHISPDGTKMFVVGNSSDLVKSYTLSVPYEFSGGSNASPDTRTFRMVQFQPMDIQESHVIVDTKKAELLDNLTVFSNEIRVDDITALDDPNNLGGINLVPGVAWIGTERIEYLAIDATGPGTIGKLIGVTRGTLGTSRQTHSTYDEIWNAGPSTRIPTLEKFSHYGDGLRLAYNDYSTSLTSAGTTPEHAFIRNAGKGTI